MARRNVVDPTAGFGDAEDDWASAEPLTSDTGTRIKFGVGDVIIGTFVGTATFPLTRDDPTGEKALYVLLDVEKGGRVNFAPGFQMREIMPKLTVGDMLRIECVGEQPTKRGLNPVKLFTIKRKPAS